VIVIPTGTALKVRAIPVVEMSTQRGFRGMKLESLATIEIPRIIHSRKLSSLFCFFGMAFYSPSSSVRIMEGIFASSCFNV